MSLLTANSKASRTVSIRRPACCGALGGGVASTKGGGGAGAGTAGIGELDNGEQGECP